MRLLYLADTRFPIERANGVQTMATCHALASRGHDVTLVVRGDTTTPPRDPFAFYGLAPTASLVIERLKTMTGARAQRMHFLTAAIRRTLTSRADVVVTRDLGLAALLLRVPARPPLVYESHGISWIVAEEMPALLGKPDLAPSPRKVARLRRREAFVWRRADAYVTITRALADDLAACFGHRERVHVVPDGGARSNVEADLQVGRCVRVQNGRPEGRGQNGRPEGRPLRTDRETPARGQAIAGYAGHLYPWKGIDVFVRALALAPSVRGLIVGGHPGEADLARVDRLVAELGLADRVTMTGLVPPSEVAARLIRATMLVLPNPPSIISERYTSPLKLFEYLSIGRPIIASDLPAFREVLTDGVSARLVRAGDPAALADAMTRVAADPALAERLAAGALALAPSYTWDRRAERLEAVFAEIARR
jgi:glycosyltransferase involved in cell wall biosynthesis